MDETDRRTIGGSVLRSALDTLQRQIETAQDDSLTATVYTVATSEGVTLGTAVFRGKRWRLEGEFEKALTGTKPIAVTVTFSRKW